MLSPYSISPSGLLSFPDLDARLGVANVVTYDNKKWGNMNPFFSRTDEDKQRIDANDQKVAKQLGAEVALALTTPPEDTFIDMTADSLRYLRLMNEKDDDERKAPVFITIRGNAIIMTNPHVEVVLAPADCAVLVFTQKNWKGMIVMHIGSPQVVQQLHSKVLTYFSVAYPDVDMSAFEVFVFPYVCAHHYPLKEKKAKLFAELHPEFKKYYTKTESGSPYGFAFMDYVKEDVAKRWGIKNWRESGLCTWEEVQNGNLFSNEVRSQVVDEKGEEYAAKTGVLGSFNVAVALK